MTDAAVDSQSAVQWVHQGNVLSLAHKNIILSSDELSDLQINFAFSKPFLTFKKTKVIEQNK